MQTTREFEVAKVMADFQLYCQGLLIEEPSCPDSYIPVIDVVLSGRLPPHFSAPRLTGMVIPLLQDEAVGFEGPLSVEYLSHTSFGVVRALTFRGWCPVHKRRHDGSSKFQLQKNGKTNTVWWKCFRDNRNKIVPFGVDFF